MKKVLLKDEVIVIEEEKKIFFSTKTETREILVDNIFKVTREEFQGKLNSITIFYNNNEEEFLIAEECNDIENVYEFVLKQRELGKQIKIVKVDIETLIESEI